MSENQSFNSCWVFWSFDFSVYRHNESIKAIITAYDFSFAQRGQTVDVLHHFDGMFRAKRHLEQVE